MRSGGGCPGSSGPACPLIMLAKAFGAGRHNAALHGSGIARQSGNVLGAFIGILLVVTVVGFLAWRFAPEYLPGFIRLELPRSPLDSTPAEAQPRAAVTAGTSAVPGREANPPLYKWKDANGVWNVTDVPPKGRAYETVRVNPETNVLPSEPGSERPEE